MASEAFFWVHTPPSQVCACVLTIVLLIVCMSMLLELTSVTCLILIPFPA